MSNDGCPTDNIATYHTDWWCGFLKDWPGFALLIEEFDLLLDAHIASELDHIEDPDNDPIDANTIGLVQRDAEERRNAFKHALLNLVVWNKTTDGKGPETPRKQETEASSG